MSDYRTVRGMRDFLPEEAEMMKYIEGKARKIAQLYGYREIITPVLETYQLLAAKTGEEIRSRMYTFKDLGGRKVALRPEFTASVARLVANTLKTEPKPLRLFCVGSLYRYDEPQQGRFREFWQSNYELMGSTEPEADVEIVMLTNRLMKAVGLKKVSFKMGHVGVLTGILNQEGIEEETQNRIMHLMDKKQVTDALHLVEESEASEKCLKTLQQLVEIKGENPVEACHRMKDQVEGYRSAGRAVDNLQEIIHLLSESGEEIDMRVEAGFARGLEYYTGIIFEVYIPQLDIALGGGGRYDKLIESFGGKPTPAVGVAHGIDRIMLAIQRQKRPRKEDKKGMIAVIPIEERLREEALRISQMLRDAGIPVKTQVMGRKLTNALADANRRDTDYAIIIGDRELKKKSVVIRDLDRREQRTVKIKKLIEIIKSLR
ncbi:MAG: histidine--tRNA ligase [Thermoproteota archaeon]